MASCPQCGEELEVVEVASINEAPLLSRSCNRAWYPGELQLRDKWDPRTRSYPADLAWDVAAAIESDKANYRGIPPEKPTMQEWARTRGAN